MRATEMYNKSRYRRYKPGKWRFARWHFMTGRAPVPKTLLPGCMAPLRSYWRMVSHRRIL